MAVRQLTLAILAAWMCVATVSAASTVTTVTTVNKAEKASGSVFDNSKPQRSPTECYVIISSSAAGQEITIATDQPFRATSEGDSVPGVGSRYRAIHFEIPSGSMPASDEGAITDEGGYRIVSSPDENAMKDGVEGATKHVVKFRAANSSILRDTAEISLTRELVPLRVKVDSLTKTSSFNRQSKLRCEEFTQTVIEPELTPQEAFWESLRQLCGKSYAHVQEPPVASTPILDVGKCDDESVLFGVHYRTSEQEPAWNRGQTWLMTRGPEGVHMKYTRTDSAAPDAKQGSWSATTNSAGTPEQQVFVPDEATSVASPGLKNFGWVVTLQRGANGLAKLTYEAVEKTDAGEVAKGGYAFDLTAPISPPDEHLWGLTP